MGKHGGQKNLVREGDLMDTVPRTNESPLLEQAKYTQLQKQEAYSECFLKQINPKGRPLPATKDRGAVTPHSVPDGAERLFYLTINFQRSNACCVRVCL